MSFECKEITDPGYIQECIDLQKEILNLSDADAFPSSFFSLLIRKEHPLGMIIGCFITASGEKKLIGLAITISDFPANSMYILFIGLIPQYQHSRYGYYLANSVWEHAHKKNVSTMYGIFDPLEANLGKLYFHMGVKVIDYIVTPYRLDTQTNNDIDKVLFEWEINKYEKQKALNSLKENFEEKMCQKLPIASDTSSTNKKLLIEIPNKFRDLSEKNGDVAKNIRNNTRKLFMEYINNRKYRITNCISAIIESERKTYYLLEQN